MNKTLKNKNGFTVFETVVVILILAVVGLVGWYVLEHKASSKNANVPTASPSTSKKTSNSTVQQVTIPKTKTLNGIAIMSPNEGEGVSIQYTETMFGATYHPFQPLQHSIGDDTKITNSNNQSIPFSSIKINDHLIVQMSVPVCAQAVVGQPGGCKFTIYSIQDLSLP